jgi:hypothetical protein
MEHDNQDTTVVPPGTTAEEALERIADAPLAAWDDEWVDLGGEG